MERQGGAHTTGPTLRRVMHDLNCYQITLRANWISLDFVVVEVITPAVPLSGGFNCAPVLSKMSVLSGDTGSAKLGWFRILKISARNCTLKDSEIFRM